MRSFALLALLDLASASAGYHYMPVEFDYGADSRVTSNFTFGSSPDAKEVKVVMDSGSANFWIWGPNAVVHWGSPYLGVVGPCNETIPTFYDPATSDTSIVTNRTSGYAYAGNAKIVSGVAYSNDTLTSIGGSGAIPNVQYALENYCLLRQRDDGTCRPVTYDQGILGLSPYTNTTTGPSFRQNLYDAGEIASKTMFMWFNKHVGALGQLTGGVLFGAIDSSKFTGPLVRVPSVIADYEIGVYVPKPVLSVGGVTFDLDQNTTCLVDSGAHADYLPFSYGSAAAEAFYNATGLVDYNGVVGYNGSCDSIPQDLNLTYTFAGVNPGESVTIDVPVRNYARGITYGPAGLCLLNLETGSCMFGAPFLTGAVMALDDADNSIALAQGAVSEEGSGVDASALKIIGAGESWDSA